ncbi:MAG: hypothetical protein ACKPAH_05155 [Verrucomicrobiota bacterium]
MYPRLLGRAAPLSRDQLLMLDEDNIGDPGPVERDLGVRSAPFEADIRRFLA